MHSLIGRRTHLLQWARAALTFIALGTFLTIGVPFGGPGASGIHADEPELQAGDLLVGVHDGKGAIIRIRNGEPALYCKSTQNQHEPMYFDTPKEVVVDSHGDVIFLAHLNTPTSSASIGPYGLWRCSAMGEDPELLGAFGSDPAFNHPRPLGDRRVRWAGGLHIKRASGFDVNTGRATTTEMYVFAVADGVDEYRDTISFSPATGDWGDYGVMDDPFQGRGYFLFDMINGGSGYENYTVSANENGMKVVLEPINLTFRIAGRLQVSAAFQKVREVVGAAVDDLSVGNADSHNCLVPLQGTPRNVFGAGNGMAGISGLGWTHDGLVMQSNSVAMGHAFIPLADMALFNIDGSDDDNGHFVSAFDCSVHEKLNYKPWHALNSYNDASGIPREVDVMSPGGTVGTQSFDGRVVGLGKSQEVQVLATGLNRAPYVQPLGIDVYPGYQPTVSGLSLVIRIDSPVNVLITDASGRRLGVDPATGLGVNDFGTAGFDSQTDEPHVYAIKQPIKGAYTIQTIGTGTGPYHVTAFGVDHARAAVTQVQFSGAATPGNTDQHEFDVDEAGVVSSDSQESADTTPPTIVSNLSAAPNSAGWYNGAVTITWNVTDAESGIATSAGCDPVTVLSDTAGVSLTCTASNAAGLHASDSVTIKLDATPPSITGSRAPEANPLGWNSSDVTASFTCTDTLSGVEPGSVTPDKTLTTEGAHQSVTGTCRDLAGNIAAATVGAINIDRTAPTMTCAPTPAILWPPNRRMMDITVAVAVSDTLAGSDTIVLRSVLINEAGLAVAAPPNDLQDWAVGTRDTNGRLRAERAGGSTGRVYTLGYDARDRAGNIATCAALISVPHDQRR